MIGQESLLLEALITMSTFEAIWLSVDRCVVVELRLRVEALGAQLAVKLSLVLVHPLMVQHILFTREPPPALFTCKRGLPGTEAAMIQKSC